MQGGLVGNDTLQQRIAVFALGVQGRERAPHRRAHGLAERVAWVEVQGHERDPQRFWLSVAGALRDTAAGSTLVRPLTAAPGLDG